MHVRSGSAVNPEDLVRDSIRGWKPPTYPGDDAGFLRMDANTNLLGQNPAAARVKIDELGLNHYPSAVSADLRASIARHHGLSPEEVIVGNGSDEVIDFITKAFANAGDVVAVPSPSFVMYGFYARVNLARLESVPLAAPEFELDADAVLSRRAKVIFLASPNNPTGGAFMERTLARILESSEGIVVIDEAYADFGDQDWSGRVRRRKNLIVLRTFSKAHGLAGLRVGYALGDAALISRLGCVKPPFDVGTFAEAAALEALRDLSFHRSSVATIRRERARLAEALRGLGFRPCRTDANFLLVDVGDGPGARRHLHSRKILTRDLSDFPGLERYIRVTVGRPEDNDRFVEALGEWKRSG